MMFCKIDISWNEKKKGGSDITCKHQRTFLLMNFTSNFIVITIPEKKVDILEDKRHTKC